MTYGAAIPRFKPRPTLDNLREPLVPFDTLPNHRSNPQGPSSAIRNSNPSTSGSVNAKNINTNANANAKSKTEQTQSNPKKTSKKGKKTTDIFGYTTSSVDSKEPSLHPIEERTESGSFVPIPIPQLKYSHSTPTPSTSSSSTLPSPSPTTLTLNAKQVTQPAGNGKSLGKSKGRLHISFGRSKTNQTTQLAAEPARLRDITEIRIANPTFTRENISARNYDAFFESGEPVYSLEYRTPITPSTPSNPFDINTTTKQSHTFGLFSKMSKSKETAKVNARSRSSDPMSTVFEKGDRCHSLNEFILYLCQLIRQFRMVFVWFNFVCKHGLDMNNNR